MHIAVCDDNVDELIRITSYLDTYRQAANASITYKTFQSATDLLATTKTGDYALFLLDVVMPGIDGMAAAREIRSFDSGAKFVFLTSSPEFAVESYEVKALDYILKPLKMQRLFSVLDDLIKEQQMPEEGITLKTKRGMTRILFSKLAYVEVVNKWLYFHLADGSTVEITAALSNFEALLLARPEFMRVHRSYIANLWQISKLTANGLITHEGKSIPVSRVLYSKVRETYVEQLFLDKGDMQ